MLLDTYIDRDSLINFVNSNIPGYKLGKSTCDFHHGYSLNGKIPFSVSEYEFNFMKDMIIQNKLKCGYELATGVGISTLALGFALSKNNGKLLSLDSYAEEVTQSIPIDSWVEKEHKEYTSSFNYTFISKLLKLFNLTNVTMECGWSPEDSKILLRKYFLSKGLKLDCVLLDCPKTDDAFIRDASFLPEFLAEKYIIFIHDIHTLGIKTQRFVEEVLQSKITIKNDFILPSGSTISQQFSFAYVNKL